METIKKHSKTADLLKVLGQKVPHASPHVSRPASPAKAAPKPSPTDIRKPREEHRVAKFAPIRGKAIQLYLHPQDEKLIREFAVWLAPHRKRINDSLVVKAVLRAAKTGPELLAAYDAALKVDGRIRNTRKPRETA